VKLSILQQMAVSGLAVEFKYGGEDRYNGNYRKTAFDTSVHSWHVRIPSRHTEDYVLEDRFSATRMEYAAFENDATLLADRYLRTLMGRIERVRGLGEGRTFTGWCKAVGVRPADLKGRAGSQIFWRDQFDQDCKAAREFAELLGGDDKVEELLSTTIR
jgi:hypothetical protein